MKPNKVLSSYIFFALMFCISFIKTEATDNVDVAYEELSISDHNETKIPLEDEESIYDPLKKIVLIDRETPYDAEMILLRGTSIRTRSFKSNKSGKKYVVYELINAIDIPEAEAFLDLMQQEIDKNLGSNPSQKQILKQIQKYLAKTYSYDYDSLYADGEKENFVVAYTQDRKIVCSQYAALVYLLCDRYGIDCKAYYGERHVFNAIRFKDEKDYTLYDFTGIKSRLITPKVSHLQSVFQSMYHLDTNDEFDMVVYKAINDRIKAHFSWTIFDALVVLVIITFLMVVYMSARIIRIKIYEKKHPPKFRRVRPVK